MTFLAFGLKQLGSGPRVGGITAFALWLREKTFISDFPRDLLQQLVQTVVESNAANLSCTMLIFKSLSVCPRSYSQMLEKCCFRKPRAIQQVLHRCDSALQILSMPSITEKHRFCVSFRSSNSNGFSTPFVYLSALQVCSKGLRNELAWHGAITSNIQVQPKSKLCVKYDKTSTMLRRLMIIPASIQAVPICAFS